MSDCIQPACWCDPTQEKQSPFDARLAAPHAATKALLHAGAGGELGAAPPIVQLKGAEKLRQPCTMDGAEASCERQRNQYLVAPRSLLALSELRLGAGRQRQQQALRANAIASAALRKTAT